MNKDDKCKKLNKLDIEIEQLKQEIQLIQSEENGYYKLIKRQKDNFVKEKEKLHIEYKKASKKISKRYMKILG